MRICIALLAAALPAVELLHVSSPDTRRDGNTALRIVHVRSDVFDAVAYDSPTRTLTLFFDRGGTYRYFDVPVGTYAGLILSESKGLYFCRNIRGRWRYDQIANTMPIFTENPRGEDSFNRKGNKR